MMDKKIENINLKNERYLGYLKDRFNLWGSECEKRVKYMAEFEAYLSNRGVDCIECASIDDTTSYLSHIKEMQGEAKARGHASIILECSELMEMFELTFIAAYISDHDEYGWKLFENLLKYTKEKHGAEIWGKIFDGCIFPSGVSNTMDTRIAFINQTELKFAAVAEPDAYKKVCAEAFKMW